MTTKTTVLVVNVSFAPGADYVRPAASIDYVAATATNIALDPFYKFLRFADILAPSDALRFTLAKPVSDSLSTPDLFRISFRRNAADAVSTSDILTRVVSFRRTFAETPALVELLAKNFSKRLADTISLIDKAQFIPVPDDFFGMTDTAHRTVAKGVAETATATDARQFSMSKSRADTATVSDSFSATTGKTLVETLITVDVAARSVAKSASEALSVNDSIQAALFGVLSSIPNSGVVNAFALND